MLLCIIGREIFNGFLSLRLSFTLLLVTAVMVSTAFLFLEDYEQQLADYDRNVQDNLQKVSQRAEGGWYALANVFSLNHQWVYRTPTQLAFLAAGHEKDLPNAFEVNAFSIQNPTRRLRENSFLQWAEDLDWVFVISVIMSFAAIVLVYDSISGERESGTLRLSMSNPVPRSTVILGKYLGTMIMLIIPLLVGMLLSMVIITTSGKVDLAGADWIRILVMVLLSLLYLSIFVLLGLFISSSLRSSAASLVILLLAWTVIAVVIPSVTGMIATRFSELPSDRDLGRAVREAHNKAGQEHGASHPESAHYWVRYWWPKLSLGRHIYCSDATVAVYRDYSDEMVANVRFGYNVTRLSPCVVYRRAAESIAGSGIDHYESFMKQVWRYRSLLRDTLISHYPLDLHKLYDGEEELERLVFQALSQAKFTGADVPTFHDDPIPVGDAMGNSLWNIVILFMFNFVFFMAAYISFLRRDVR
jgi:ABC-type transport system involved in multi-copper enzyme maturation permease subunit